MKTTKQFFESCYMWGSFKKKVFNHATFKKVKPLKLQSFTLDKAYHDTQLQEKCNSQAVDVDTFLVTVKKLIEEEKIDKENYYIAHVKVKQVVVAVYFHWSGDRFIWDAGGLDCGDRWNVGGVFLFFATDTKTLIPDSLNLDSLKLRIKKLEEWAKHIGYYCHEDIYFWVCERCGYEVKK